MVKLVVMLHPWSFLATTVAYFPYLYRIPFLPCCHFDIHRLNWQVQLLSKDVLAGVLYPFRNDGHCHHRTDLLIGIVIGGAVGFILYGNIRSSVQSY